MPRASFQSASGRSQPSSQNGHKPEPLSHSHTNATATNTAYDPSQDPELKRKIRKGYRDLIAETEETKKNVASYKPQDLVNLIRKTDALYENVVTPGEGILDSKSLLNMSDIGNQMAKKMKLNSDAFDVEEYVTRLAKFMGGSAQPSNANQRNQQDANDNDDNDDDDDNIDDEDINTWDWDKLGQTAAKYSRRAPTLDFLLGPLAMDSKARKNAARSRADEEPSEKVGAQQLQPEDLKKSSHNDTSSFVSKVGKSLATFGRSGVNLFHFAINPQSFSNTIENLFYVSFLIREGKASLKDDSNGDPILTLCEPPSTEDYENGLEKKQFVLEFDIKTYNELIKVYNIKESIIPHREPSAQNRVNQSGWYS